MISAVSFWQFSASATTIFEIVNILKFFGHKRIDSIRKAVVERFQFDQFQ